MTIKLRQSTASQEIPLGYFLDSTDGNTEETALTIANTDIKLWKMGATTLANKNSGGATHISNGLYYAVLDATDTDTLGGLVVFVHVAGALAVKVECEVLPANIYDALIAGSDKLQVDTVEVSGTTQTAGDVPAMVTAVDDYVDTEVAAVLAAVDTEVAAIKTKTDQLTFTTANKVDSSIQAAGDFAQAAADKVWATGTRALTDKAGFSLSAAGVAAIWDALLTGITTVGSIGKLLKDNIDAAISSRSTYAGADTAGTTTLLSRLTAGRATNLDNLDATVSSRLATAGYTAPPSVGAIADQVWDEAIAGHAGVGSTGEALADAAAGGGGGGSSAADIWDYPTASATTVGSMGKLIVDKLAAMVFSLANKLDVNLKAIEGELTDGNNAVLKLKQLNIQNDDLGSFAGRAVAIRSGDTYAVHIDSDVSYGVLIDGDITSLRLQAGLTMPSGYLDRDEIADAVWAEPTRTLTEHQIKKNDALNNFSFLMKSSSDHVSPVTGLTVTAQRSIDGGAFAATANPVTEVGSGIYKIDLAASDLNGDVITFKFTATGADQRTITVITQQ